jgi:hypothetical protein
MNNLNVRNGSGTENPCPFGTSALMRIAAFELRSQVGHVTLTANTGLFSSRKNLALREIKGLGCAKTNLGEQPNGYTQLM